MKDVRWRDDTGFEGKCDACLDWWPIDGDYWNADRGFRICRACIRQRLAVRQAERRKDPAFAALESQRWHAWYVGSETARAAHARRQRIRYQNDPVFREQRKAASKAYAAANREKRRAYMRDWYRRNRVAA